MSFADIHVNTYIAAQAFEAGLFLNIFLRLWTFWGSSSYKNSYIYVKNPCILIFEINALEFI